MIDGWFIESKSHPGIPGIMICTGDMFFS